MVEHGGDDEAGHGDDMGDVEPFIEAIANGTDREHNHGGEEAVRGPAPSELGPHEYEAEDGLTDASVLVELDAPCNEMRGAKQPDDPTSPLVQERKSVESIASEEACREQSERNLLERHDEHNRNQPHGDVTGTVACCPPCAIG